MDDQRCGTCTWWKIHDGQENRIDCATGDCTYPLPICLPDEYRITPYAKSRKGLPHMAREAGKENWLKRGLRIMRKELKKWPTWKRTTWHAK